MQDHAEELSLTGRRIQGSDTQCKAATRSMLGWGIMWGVLTPRARAWALWAAGSTK